MEPILSFVYNVSTNDSPYLGTGQDLGDWMVIDLSGTPDKKIFTGGGINGTVATPTAPVGTRDATVRPLTGTSVVPQVFIESTNDSLMRNVPLAGKNTNRYVFGVYVNGYIASDLYLEYWDTSDFTTTDSPVLSGTTSYPYSMVNAIRTTDSAPPVNWHGTTVSGGSAECLAGYDHRIGLKNASSIEDECVYYNMYIQLPYDADLFHSTPVEAFRYLYV